MSSNFIEDFSFGKIVIDGERYTDDIILIDKEIRSGWWRNRAHTVSKNDLAPVIDFEPELLIIGTGSSGRMDVPTSLYGELKFKIESYPTNKACKRYNELIKKEMKLAGAFHLTC